MGRNEGCSAGVIPSPSEIVNTHTMLNNSHQSTVKIYRLIKTARKSAENLPRWGGEGIDIFKECGYFEMHSVLLSSSPCSAEYETEGCRRTGRNENQNP